MAVLSEGEITSPPVFRSQGSLFSIVSDRHNFGACDSESLSGFAFLSQKTAEHHPKLREYYLEAMAYLLLSQRYIVPLHAACVARAGSGVLLCGPSETGKSTLAFACGRAGWTYVSDDCTWLLPETDASDRMAIGRSHMARFRKDAPRVFPELEGYVARARPNGKISIEVPMRDFPYIRTSRCCRIDRVVFLEREPGTPGAWEMSSEEMLERLVSDMPTYNEEVNAMYARTVHRLAEVRSYRMRYESLSDALEILATLAL